MFKPLTITMTKCVHSKNAALLQTVQLRAEQYINGLNVLWH